MPDIGTLIAADNGRAACGRLPLLPVLFTVAAGICLAVSLPVAAFKRLNGGTGRFRYYFLAAQRATWDRIGTQYRKDT